MSLVLSVLWGALCGAALIFSLAPFDIWPLAFVSAGGLFFLLEHYPNRFLPIAIAFGFAKYGFGLSWVYVSIHDYGAASPLLAGSLVVLLTAIMTTLTWLQCRAYVLRRTSSLMWKVTLFATWWTWIEWLWSNPFFGFPWLFAGYSQLQTPLSGFAPIGGVLLISFFVALVGAALFSLSRRNWWMAAVVVAPMLLGFLIQDVQWTKAVGTQTVALVQGNTEQSVKWDEDRRDQIVRTHVRLTAPYWGEVDTIVWPESAITSWAHEAGFLLDRLHAEGERSSTALVTGIPIAEREDEDVHVYNGVIAVGTGEGRYLKQMLVPFGEYVPFESVLRGLIAFFDLPMSAFTEGPYEQPLLRINGVPAVMLICYEVAFPRFVAQETREAEVLLTISNDTWFGGSIGPLQHMQIAQMRARELDRWVLRATNNGLTGIVNSRGEIVASIPRFEEGVLTGTWERRQGTTPWQRLGELPLILFLVLIVMFAESRRRKQADSPPHAE